MTKLYRSKAAAIRHAIDCLGPNWEEEAFVHESRLPGEEFIYSIHMKGSQAASRGSKPATAIQAAPNPSRARSRIEGATKRARAIAERMRGKPRREVIAACVKEGIAQGTAATQYQAWRAMQKEKKEIR